MFKPGLQTTNTTISYKNKGYCGQQWNNTRHYTVLLIWYYALESSQSTACRLELGNKIFACRLLILNNTSIGTQRNNHPLNYFVFRVLTALSKKNFQKSDCFFKRKVIIRLRLSFYKKNIKLKPDFNSSQYILRKCQIKDKIDKRSWAVHLQMYLDHWAATLTSFWIKALINSQHL